MVRFPAQATHFSLRQTAKTYSGVHPASYSGGTRRQGIEIDRSPPTTAEVRMRRAIHQLPPHAFMTYAGTLSNLCPCYLYTRLWTYSPVCVYTQLSMSASTLKQYSNTEARSSYLVGQAFHLYSGVSHPDYGTSGFFTLYDASFLTASNLSHKSSQ